MSTAEEKQTVIIIPDRGDTATISIVGNRKYMNRLEKLVEMGVAEEIESSVEGAREFELPKTCFRVPFYREYEPMSEERKAAGAARLAAVREQVQAAKAAAAKKAGKGKPKASEPAPAAPAPTGKNGKGKDKPVLDQESVQKGTSKVAAGKSKPAPAPAKPAPKGKKPAKPALEDLEDELDEELNEEVDDLEDDEMDEVIVKAPAKKGASAPVKKGKK